MASPFAQYQRPNFASSLATASGGTGKYRAAKSSPFADALEHAAKLREMTAQNRAVQIAPAPLPRKVVAPGMFAPIASDFEQETGTPGTGETPAGGVPVAGTPTTGGGATPSPGGVPTAAVPTIPATTTPARIRPSNPPAAEPIPPNTSRYSDEYWTKLVTWSRSPGYEWLMSTPGIIDDYERSMNAQQAQDVDFVDWARDMFPQMSHPLAERRGYDTWRFSSPGVPRFPDQAGPIDPNAPNVPQVPVNQRPPQVVESPYVPPVKSPPVVESPYVPQIAPQIVPPVDPFTPEQETPPTGSKSPTIPIGSTPTTPTYPSVPFGDDLSRAIRDTEQRLRPGFDRQADDLQRRMRQSAAISGALGSGGFGQVEGDALTGLASDQGTLLSKEINDLYSGQMTDDLERLRIAQAAATEKRAQDLQKYLGELNDAVARLQIKTNADIETKAQELQKYGIDQGDLLDRYKAELSLKGQTYSADRQLDAAALSAAAQKAAAAKSAASAAQSQQYAADLQRKNALLGADVTREGNLMDYLYKIASLGPDWAKWIAASDPFGILTGAQVPGDVVVRP